MLIGYLSSRQSDGDIEDLRSQNDSLRTEAEIAKKEVFRLRRQVETDRAKLARMRAIVVGLRAELANASSEVMGLRRRNTELSRESGQFPWLTEYGKLMQKRVERAQAEAKRAREERDSEFREIQVRLHLSLRANVGWKKKYEALVKKENSDK
jgi:chromosome segregation ATPase